MKLMIATLTLSLIVAAGARAQMPLDGVPPVLPTRSEDCDEHHRQWTARFRQAEAARDACQRRDGIKVSNAGVWLPNCGRRTHANVACAAQSDQVCAVSTQSAASVKACRTALAKHREAERIHAEGMRKRESQAAAARAAVKAELSRINAVRSTYDELREKGIAGTVIDRYSTTPDRASGKINEYLREAARTANTQNPGRSPTLDDIGELSDGIYERMPFNPIVKEVGRQSSAAARARMGDALGRLDRAMEEAETGFALPPAQAATPSAVVPAFPAPLARGDRYGQTQPTAPTRTARPAAEALPGEDDESLEDDDPDTRARAANMEVMRRVIDQSQQLQQQLQQRRMQQLQQMRARAASGDSNVPGARPTCRGGEVVGPGVDAGLPRCRR